MKGTTILQKVIDEINLDPMVKIKDDDLIIMNELCMKMQNQEMEKLHPIKRGVFEKCSPSGSNIYLTVPVPHQKHIKETNCITLQNDPLSGWSVCFYVDFGGTGQYKLKRRHDIESTKPNHVVTEFARIYKAYLGRNTVNL
jgi:hypothetical protein